MSKLGYEQIITKMTTEGYINTQFALHSIGDYSVKDSDWNYKDVPHLNIVHKNVSCIQAIVEDDVVGSINFLKIPFIRLTLPLIFVNYEVNDSEQVYFSSFGPFLILVKTSAINDSDRVKVSTNFCILSKKFFNFLHPLIKKMIVKNNKILMSEDIPMRERRFELRESDHDFYNPSDTYSFKFTEEIYRANVFMNSKSYVDINYEQIKNSKDGDILGESCGILSFFVKDDKGLKSLWPTTCPHEGAKMDKSCILKSRILCPWHHRRIDRLLDFNGEIKKIIPSIDYCVEKLSNGVRVHYRNNPKYYNTRPYEIFRKS